MKHMEWLEEVRNIAEERIEEAHRVLEATKTIEAFCDEAMPKPDPSPVGEIHQKALAVLSASPGPLHRKDIYELLLEAGTHIGGKDPIASLGSILSRFHQDFVSHGNGQWWVKREQPYEVHRNNGMIEVDEIPF